MLHTILDKIWSCRFEACWTRHSKISCHFFKYSRPFRAEPQNNKSIWYLSIPALGLLTPIDRSRKWHLFTFSFFSSFSLRSCCCLCSAHCILRSRRRSSSSFVDLGVQEMERRKNFLLCSVLSYSLSLDLRFTLTQNQPSQSQSNRIDVEGLPSFLPFFP